MNFSNSSATDNLMSTSATNTTTYWRRINQSVHSIMTTTSSPLTLASDELTATEKESQRIFATAVIASYFSFVLLVIAYVGYHHIKNKRRERQQ